MDCWETIHLFFKNSCFNVNLSIISVIKGRNNKIEQYGKFKHSN